jgi:hypothetical protein
VVRLRSLLRTSPSYLELSDMRNEVLIELEGSISNRELRSELILRERTRNERAAKSKVSLRTFVCFRVMRPPGLILSVPNPAPTLLRCETIRVSRRGTTAMHSRQSQSSLGSSCSGHAVLGR